MILGKQNLGNALFTKGFMSASFPEIQHLTPKISPTDADANLPELITYFEQ